MSVDESTVYPILNLYVNHYRSKYDLQQEALAHTEQQAIKGLKIDQFKTIRTEKNNGLIYIKNVK